MEDTLHLFYPSWSNNPILRPFNMGGRHTSTSHRVADLSIGYSAPTNVAFLLSITSFLNITNKFGYYIRLGSQNQSNQLQKSTLPGLDPSWPLMPKLEPRS